MASSESTPQVTNTETTETTQTPQHTGTVKWFNGGFGFITQLSEGEHQGNDIFVHQSNINTTKPVYRNLNSGETVMFDLEATKEDKHPFHAINVSGYNGASLQCESRLNTRPTYNNNYHNGGQGGGGRFYNPRGRFQGGRNNGNGNSNGNGRYQKNNYKNYNPSGKRGNPTENDN